MTPHKTTTRSNLRSKSSRLAAALNTTGYPEQSGPGLQSKTTCFYSLLKSDIVYGVGSSIFPFLCKASSNDFFSFMSSRSAFYPGRQED